MAIGDRRFKASTRAGSKIRLILFETFRLKKGTGQFPVLTIVPFSFASHLALFGFLAKSTTEVT
jgi:hypothetical protein